MNWSQENYIRALEFAADAHGDQLVPGSVRPYTVHLTKVAMEVMAALAVSPELDGDFAVQCALLHDVIEDTRIRFWDVEEVFGNPIARGVRALTKNRELPKADRMMDSLRRIQMEPREVAMVKLADRITNMAKPPFTWLKPKRIAYQREAEVILETLGDADAFLAARLRMKIDAYTQWLV